MPKTTFAQENKITNSNEFPRLKLEHGERALIVCIEPEPEMEFVHTLRAPEIGPDGKALMETKQGKKGDYEAQKLEFVGQHLCFGNFDVMSDRGADPDNCPTCRAARDEQGIDTAQPRYAMHILRYTLKPGGWQVATPFAVTCEAWVFAPGRFNTLVDLATEWDDLRQHDLKLGPCENKMYQKYDINVSAKAEWLKDDERKAHAAEVYQQNRTEDLAALIGRKISKGQAEEDIARVLERVAQANGRSLSPDLPSAAASASSNIDSEVADLLGGKPEAGIDPWATSTPAPESASAENFAADKPATKSGEDLDLADVLAGL
jgi:hypothetical protein